MSRPARRAGIFPVRAHLRRHISERPVIFAARLMPPNCPFERVAPLSIAVSSLTTRGKHTAVSVKMSAA